MKAIFIAYNQAYNQEIAELLEANGQRGSVDGEPHLGNHAWPTQNHAIFSAVEDDLVPGIMEALRKKDRDFKDLGLRAYTWAIEEAL